MSTPAHIACTGFNTDLAVEADGPTTWRLTRPLVYTGSKGDTWTVPAGFVTDFASVPRLMHWLTLPYGAYTRAAVLHDYLLGLIGDPDPELAVASRDADGVFRLAMQELGVPWPKRWSMWAAVRVGALCNPRRAPGRAFLRDSPKVVGVLLASLILLPDGVLGVSLSLAKVGVVNAITAIPDRRRRRRIQQERTEGVRTNA